MPYFSIRDFPSEDGAAHREVIQNETDALWVRSLTSDVNILAHHTHPTFLYATQISPFVVACANGNRELVHWFIMPTFTDEGSSYIPAFRRRVDHSGALEIAWDHRDIDIVLMLVTQRYFRNYLASHPLLLKELIFSNIDEVIEALLEKINESVNLEYYSLIFKFLIEQKNDIYFLGCMDRWTINQSTLDAGLIIACQYGHIDMVNYLLENPRGMVANPAVLKQMAIFRALENNRDEVVGLLFQDERVSVLSENNDFLNLAIRLKKPYVAQLMTHPDVTIAVLKESLSFAQRNNRPEETIILLKALSLLKQDESVVVGSIDDLIARGPQFCTSIRSELLWIEHYYQQMQWDLEEKKKTSADPKDLESGAVRHEVAASKKHLDRIQREYRPLLESQGLEEVEKRIRAVILTKMKNSIKKPADELLLRAFPAEERGSDTEVETDSESDVRPQRRGAVTFSTIVSDAIRDSEVAEAEAEVEAEAEATAVVMNVDQIFLEENFDALVMGDLVAFQSAASHFRDTEDAYQNAWRCFNPYSPVGSYSFLDQVLGLELQEKTEKLFTRPLVGEENQPVPSDPAIHSGALNIEGASLIIRTLTACVFLAIESIPEEELREQNIERFIQSISECCRSNNEDRSRSADKRGCYAIAIREMSLALSLHPTLSLHDSIYVIIKRQAQSYIQKKFVESLEACKVISNISVELKVQRGQALYEALCMLCMVNKKILLSSPESLPCYEVHGAYQGYTPFLLDLRGFFKNFCGSIKDFWTEIQACIDPELTYAEALPYMQYFLTDLGGDFVSTALGEEFVKWEKSQMPKKTVEMEWKNPFPKPCWTKIIELFTKVPKGKIREDNALKMYYSLAYQHYVMDTFYKSLRYLLERKRITPVFFSNLKNLLEWVCDLNRLGEQGLNILNSEEWLGYMMSFSWGSICMKFEPKSSDPSDLEYAINEAVSQFQSLPSPILEESSSKKLTPPVLRFSSEAAAAEVVDEVDVDEPVQARARRRLSSTEWI